MKFVDINEEKIRELKSMDLETTKKELYEIIRDNPQYFFESLDYWKRVGWGYYDPQMKYEYVKTRVDTRYKDKPLSKLKKEELEAIYRRSAKKGFIYPRYRGWVDERGKKESEEKEPYILEEDIESLVKMPKAFREDWYGRYEKTEGLLEREQLLKTTRNLFYFLGEANFIKYDDNILFLENNKKGTRKKVIKEVFVLSSEVSRGEVTQKVRLYEETDDERKEREGYFIYKQQNKEKDRVYLGRQLGFLGKVEKVYRESERERKKREGEEDYEDKIYEFFEERDFDFLPDDLRSWFNALKERGIDLDILDTKVEIYHGKVRIEYPLHDNAIYIDLYDYIGEEIAEEHWSIENIIKDHPEGLEVIKKAVRELHDDCLTVFGDDKKKFQEIYFILIEWDYSVKEMVKFGIEDAKKFSTWVS